jgi:acyl-CoA thioesterase-1
MKERVQVKKFGALVIAVVLVSWIASAALPPRRILVFGDSLSDGYGLSRSEAYPALLAEKLDASGLRYEVVNSSAPGDTTDNGLSRLPPHLKRGIDIFILELGINDAFRGAPVEDIRKNLEGIINKVKARNPNVRIIICGMQLPNHATRDYFSAFGQMYVDLAANNHAALVPYLLEGVAGNPTLNQTDYIHPNIAGQKILAENVWRVLEPIARKIAADTTTPAASHER